MEASYNGNDYSQGPIIQRCPNARSLCLKTEGRISDELWGLLKGCSSSSIFEVFTLATCVSEGCHWSWTSDGNACLQCCCFSDFCNAASMTSSAVTILAFNLIFYLFREVMMFS